MWIKKGAEKELSCLLRKYLLMTLFALLFTLLLQPATAEDYIPVFTNGLPSRPFPFSPPDLSFSLSLSLSLSHSQGQSQGHRAGE